MSPRAGVSIVVVRRHGDSKSWSLSYSLDDGTAEGARARKTCEVKLSLLFSFTRRKPEVSKPAASCSPHYQVNAANIQSQFLCSTNLSICQTSPKLTDNPAQSTTSTE